jgi:UDP-glucuronate decarboxylase
LRNADITIYGDGAQTRFFCYIDDLVDGLIRLMESNDDVVGPINLGNPGEFTIRQLAEIVVDLAGSPAVAIKTIQSSAVPISAKRTSCSVGDPSIALRDGLNQTIAYFEELLSKETVAA